MQRQQIRVKSVNTSFRSVEPKYAASLVVFDVDGIEVPISVPLQQGDGEPSGHAQIEQFLRNAADAFAAASAEMARQLKGE